MESGKEDRIDPDHLEKLSNECLIEMIASIRKILENRPKIEKNIIINKKYGAFAISKDGAELYKKILLENCSEEKLEEKFEENIQGFRLGVGCREDPILIEVIEKLGDKVNERCSDLKVEKIFLCPGEDYDINEYDGLENITIISG